MLQKNLYYKFIYKLEHRCYTQISNRAMPGKETEMRTPVFAMWFKSEYKQLSMCSYNDQQHVPLSRPYEMLDVISASKQP